MAKRLIYLEDAIDAVCEAFCYAYCDNCEKELDEDLCGDCHRKYQNWSASRKTVEKVINALPSAQPERKKGEWRGYNTEEPHKWLRSDGTPIFLICSECCGTVMNNGSAHWNFCPNCGADMRGEQGE